jgi:hypothetical protein
MIRKSWNCVQCEAVEFSTENEARQHTVETRHSIQELLFSQHEPIVDPRWVSAEDGQ